MTDEPDGAERTPNASHLSGGTGSGGPQTGAPGPLSGMRSGPGAPPHDTPRDTPPGATREDDAPGVRVMRRDADHKKIAGVCAGLGRYFDLDPVVFRVVLAVLTISGGLGLLLYSLGWLLMPVDEDGRSELQRMFHHRFDASSGQALLAVLIGAGVFLSFFNNRPGFFPWLLLALLIGAVSWSSRHRSDAAEGADIDPDRIPSEPEPPKPASGPSWWQRNDPMSKSYVKAPLMSPGPPLWVPDPWATEAAPDGKRKQRRIVRPYQRERSLLGVAVGFFALAAGLIVAAAVGARTHRPVFAVELGLVTSVALLGAGLVLGAWIGRVRAGAVALAALLTLLLAGATALPSDMDQSLGRRTWAPATAAEVRPSYKLGAWDAVLDLSNVDPGGRTLKVNAELGAGRLLVRLPADVDANVRAHSQLGGVRLQGLSDRGTPWGDDTRSAEHIAASAGGASRGTVDLSLHVGIGEVEVDVASA
ncbi:hypothetical protein BIV57_18355 [Mangrovactinospora gilvigrisea]|uniref:Phage shock protein PspC N-terminal domain-containing protein n=1 Tax=Mangrovactinospora gilvigrisea TaxID=1428644 RepID=A0A1J7C8V8_9ACTN|nr:PspC domain-containing protein [Mangrovactinospora gilvigrisea]OIV36050.1 hypothetical protein BIV57_18355 [Mangrovactinospora gilvigrisea]